VCVCVCVTTEDGPEGPKHARPCRVSLINGIKMIQVVEEAKRGILRLGTYSRKCHHTALINLQTSGVAPEGYENQQ
jgi:hypothetical protein